MVKVQKPKPKSIKKNALENIMKTQLKKGKVSSSKGNVKKTDSVVKTGAMKELVKNVQQEVKTTEKTKMQQLKEVIKEKKGNTVNKKALVEVQENTDMKNPQKKNAIAKKKENTVNKKGLAAVQETKKNAVPEKQETRSNKVDLAEVHKTKIEKSLKKKAPSKVQQSTAKKNLLKKKPVAKVQGNAQEISKKKKSVAIKVEKKVLPASKVEQINKLSTKVGNNNEKSGVQIGQKSVKKQEDPDPVKHAPKIFEAIDFDEEKFKSIVSLENIKKISEALKILVEKEVSEKKTSIFSDYKYFLNVASYKIPNCPKRMVKLNLKHSLVNTIIDDVVMIVADLKRGAKVEYEPTIQHYEDMLREIDLENIKIVPFAQLRNECTSFEAKRKFANSYDYFMCDGRIVAHVAAFCGKHFQKPRSTIHAVRLDNPKTYKKDIEHALCRTSYKQLQKGDMTSILVGNHRFTINQLSENIEHVIEQLKTIFAGGYANIRNMHMKIDIRGTSSLPLYINMGGAPAEVPNIIGPREQRMIKLKKEANDILSKFNMSKSGEFVKLNKAQVKHKQNMREVRAALLSKEDNDSNDELNPSSTKKVKKDESDSNNNTDDDESENDSDNSNNEENEISDDE